VSPTFETTERFKRDHSKLSPPEQARFKEKVRQSFVPAIESRDFPPGLRVKGVQGAEGIYEMTWAPDGRATFQYGPEQIPGQTHVIWRRIGGHEVFGSP
jgi:hypothetical protein